MSDVKLVQDCADSSASVNPNEMITADGYEDFGRLILKERDLEIDVTDSDAYHQLLELDSNGDGYVDSDDFDLPEGVSEVVRREVFYQAVGNAFVAGGILNENQAFGLQYLFNSYNSGRDIQRLLELPHEKSPSVLRGRLKFEPAVWNSGAYDQVLDHSALVYEGIPVKKTFGFIYVRSVLQAFFFLFDVEVPDGSRLVYQARCEEAISGFVYQENDLPPYLMDPLKESYETYLELSEELKDMDTIKCKGKDCQPKSYFYTSSYFFGGIESFDFKAGDEFEFQYRIVKSGCR